jgi:aspartyl-tRNA(Asn)/glutamyl-tRNA(Gln) amidotransferase subunit C
MPDQKITLDQVRHVAKLARLSLGEDKLEKLAGQLEHILEYVEKINAVDTSSVEPTAHAVHLTNVLREDVPEPALPIDKVLQNAPDTDGPFGRMTGFHHRPR